MSDKVFAVAWDHVGFYNEQETLNNTFMVMISDGYDASMGIGNNVCFCYEDMQWTAGSMSGGKSGFGGTPATKGVNKGDGNAVSHVDRFYGEWLSRLGPGISGHVGVGAPNGARLKEGGKASTWTCRA